MTTTTHTARQLTGRGTLPTEHAMRTLKAMQEIGELLGTPHHILIEAAVKQVLLDTGVNLEAMLVDSPQMTNIEDERRGSDLSDRAPLGTIPDSHRLHNRRRPSPAPRHDA